MSGITKILKKTLKKIKKLVKKISLKRKKIVQTKVRMNQKDLSNFWNRDLTQAMIQSKRKIEDLL